MLEPSTIQTASRAVPATELPVTSCEDVERLRVELSDAFVRARATIEAVERLLLAAALFGGAPDIRHEPRDQRRVA
jgi:hypothetical protein